MRLRHRARALFTAIVLVALVGLVPILAPTPASADHAPSAHPHWRSWEHPIVNTPTCYYYGNSTNFCNLVADAAYYWQDRGFFQGYTPPLPTTDLRRCEGYFGRINVCFIDSSDPRLQGKRGLTQSWSYDFNGDPAHAAGVLIYVCGNCSTYDIQRTLRHEFGHALGLGHTGDSTCVMHDPAIVLGETCQHDRDAMREMYSHTDP